MSEIEFPRVIPVISSNRSDSASGLAEALVKGGLPCAEVTLRTDAAIELIKRLSKDDRLLVGAGTVHSVDDAERAVAAGARFLVTPGINLKTLEWCSRNSVCVIPGVSNPTDLETLLEFDIGLAKFFPAEPLGGVAMLKALSGPYNGMRFVPTGGINKENVGDYLALKNVLACGGSWVAPTSLIDSHRFDEIEVLVSECVTLICQ
ncbi:MAG: bifunctional 4-hydroxy-2-oxoglutarate aldolase/2-dehydro-3-deoxy-phosphogluconate aldolase [Verrucomicrobiota bacterium]